MVLPEMKNNYKYNETFKNETANLISSSLDIKGAPGQTQNETSIPSPSLSCKLHDTWFQILWSTVKSPSSLELIAPRPTHHQ